MADLLETTIETYNRIAPYYVLTALPEIRAWEEESMEIFSSHLPGDRVLVPGCGDGRDSHYLSNLNLSVLSIDLSTSMLAEANRNDPNGEHVLHDMRSIKVLNQTFDGVFANGCLYHLQQEEFIKFLADLHTILTPNGIFYLSMKMGEGSELKSIPGPGYPGGKASRTALAGPRFYQYYQHHQLIELLTQEFTIIQHRPMSIQQEGVHEYWLRDSSCSA